MPKFRVHIECVGRVDRRQQKNEIKRGQRWNEKEKNGSENERTSCTHRPLLHVIYFLIMIFIFREKNKRRKKRWKYSNKFIVGFRFRCRERTRQRENEFNSIPAQSCFFSFLSICTFFWFEFTICSLMRIQDKNRICPRTKKRSKRNWK